MKYTWILYTFTLILFHTCHTSDNQKAVNTQKLFQAIIEHKTINFRELENDYIKLDADINALYNNITPFALALRHSQYVTAWNLADKNAVTSTLVHDIGGVIQKASPYHMIALASQDKADNMYQHMSWIILLAFSKNDPRLFDSNNQQCDIYAHSFIAPIFKELIKICTIKNKLGLPKKIIKLCWQKSKKKLADPLHFFNIALQIDRKSVVKYCVQHFHKDINAMLPIIPSNTDFFSDKNYIFYMKKAWECALKKYTPSTQNNV